MSSNDARKLERTLKRDGTFADFLVQSLEEADAATLFRVRDAVDRTLAQRAAGKNDHRVKTVEELVEGITSLARTGRGFANVGFEELYGSKCSIQDSSLATQAAIWLGVDNVPVKAFLPEGARFHTRLEFEDGRRTGWADVKHEVTGRDYASVLKSGRMHLSQHHVQALLPFLQNFVEHGTIAGASDS